MKNTIAKTFKSDDRTKVRHGFRAGHNLYASAYAFVNFSNQQDVLLFIEDVFKLQYLFIEVLIYVKLVFWIQYSQMEPYT